MNNTPLWPYVCGPTVRQSFAFLIFTQVFFFFCPGFLAKKKNRIRHHFTTKLSWAFIRLFRDGSELAGDRPRGESRVMMGPGVPCWAEACGLSIVGLPGGLVPHAPWAQLIQV